MHNNNFAVTSDQFNLGDGFTGLGHHGPDLALLALGGGLDRLLVDPGHLDQQLIALGLQATIHNLSLLVL